MMVLRGVGDRKPGIWLACGRAGLLKLLKWKKGSESKRDKKMARQHIEMRL